MSSKLENFGQIFISEVRDNTLETFEKIFDDRYEMADNTKCKG